MEIVSLVRRLLFAKQHFLPRAESGSQRVFDPFLWVFGPLLSKIQLLGQGS